MRELWLRFDNISDYNAKYQLICNLIGKFPGNDIGYAMLSDTKQRVSFSLSVTRDTETEAKTVFGASNVAVRPAFEPIAIPAAQPMQTEPVQTEPIQTEPVQTEVSQTEPTQAESLQPTETIKIEGINMPVEIEETIGEEDEPINEPVSETVDESANEPADESTDEPTGEVIDNTEESTDKNTETPSEEIVWEIPSDAGLKVFEKQWKTLIKNTEKVAKDERKTGKNKNTELVIAQINAMASIMEKAIIAWAADSDFEEKLKLPWKSVERMTKYVRDQAQKMAVNKVAVFSGFAETEEELKSMPPFSFIYDYYNADDKAEVEEEMKKENEEKVKEAEKNAKTERSRLIAKAKRNSESILERAKTKARAKLEESEEFKALSKMKQGREVSKEASNFMDEARAEYTAEEEKRNVREKLLEAVKTDLATTVKKMKAAERDKTFEEEVSKRYKALSEAEKHPGIPEWTKEQFPDEYEQEEKTKKKTPAKKEVKEISDSDEQISLFDMVGA